MSGREPDDVIRAWFREGPNRGRPESIEETLARLAAMPQGRRREVRMPLWIPAAAVVTLLLAAIVAFGAGFRIVPPSPSESSRPSASTAPGTTCRLELPVHGRDAVLFGVGFAPDADVTLVIDRANGTRITIDATNGGPHTDRTGGFFTPLRPFPEDLGRGRITATAGCTATLETEVTADDLPAPCPDPAVESNPLVDGPAYREAVAADQPLAWWGFDDRDLGTDATGRHSGTIRGTVEPAVRSPLSDGGAAYFHHQFPGDAYIEIDPIVLAGDFSIEFWLYFCHWAEADPIVGNAENNASVLIGEGAGELHLNDGGNDLVWTGVPLISGAWQHYVVTRAGDALEIYHDGKLEGFEYGAAWTDPFVVALIGRNFSDNFLGYLDEVALYDHALTADRIAAHANP
jgi:hypothetical protein